MVKPKIAVTMGDPAGIGPEIIVKALSRESVRGQAVCVVVGDAGVLQLAMKTTGIQMKIHRIESAKEAEDAPGVLNLIDMENVRLDAFAWGRVSAMCGQAAYAYIEKSIAMANAGEADAVCTAPINKEALHAAGVPYIGHTEILAPSRGPRIH